MTSRPLAHRSGYHTVHLPGHPARAAVWRAVADYLAGWIPAGASVLEIGAGYCDWINAVRAGERLAVDVWPEVASHASDGVRTAVLDVTTGLRGLGGARFDVVLASNVLEHFEPPVVSSVADDLSFVLRAGGRLLVIQPNFRHAYREYFDDYTHRSVFTDVSLPNLLRAHGFAIDRVEPRFLPYSMRELRLRVPAWCVRAYLASPIRPRSGQMLVVARRI